MGWILAGVVVLVLVGALLLFIRKVAGMKGEVDAARAEFLQKVGYEYASGLTVGKPAGREKITPDGKFSYHYEVYSEGGKRITAQGWELAASKPPRVTLQLIDKSLIGARQALMNLVGPVKRSMTVVYPGPHPIGDAELDARFALHSPNAEAAADFVRKPEMKKALLELVSVTLLVSDSGASFGDPGDANVYAPGSGASRTDLNPAPSIRSAARVHLAVERLLRISVGGNP
ncbi:MAG TPA: hypothetical protein VE981_13415 [Planctomycetota bacterium]|nr:hypothetical protein [Planctomycetota bacterium]